MYTLLTLFLVLLGIVLHELAHGLNMRKRGVRIAMVGLGLPIRPRFVIPAGKFGLPFAVSLSPILVVAFVNPVPEDMSKLSYRQAAWVYGSGAITHLIYGCGILALYTANLSGGWTAVRWLVIAACLLLASGLWLGRYWLTGVLIPIIGLLLLIGFFYAFVKGLGKPGGLIAAGGLMHQPSLSRALLISGLLAIALGLVNMIPLWPFDGGRIMGEVLRKWYGQGAVRTWELIGTAISLALFAYRLLSDGFYLKK